MRKIEKIKREKQPDEYEFNEVAMVVCSLAGRDKGQLYIWGATDQLKKAILFDGKNKTITHPKHKKLKHFQILKKVEDEAWNRLRLNGDFGVKNAQIRRLIREYKQACNVVYQEVHE